MTSYVNKVMQFRDILNACGEDLFGLCVEAKVKGQYLAMCLDTWTTNAGTDTAFMC